MIHFPPHILSISSTIADGNMSFRIGDTSKSLENRKRFLLHHKVDFNNHICMKCTHGDNISPVSWTNADGYFGATTQERMLESEVLITQEKELALVLLTADCIPASFYDPITQTIALAHFSKQTIIQMLPQKTIGFLREHFVVNPANLIVHFGPHIHAQSYHFPLPQQPPPPALIGHLYQKENNEHTDIAGAATAQLHACGIPTKHISISPVNTATSPYHFSHYQSRTEHTSEGRLASILMMR